MSVAPLQLQSRRRAIRVWLLVVAALVFAVAFVGGATRLTGSGLSIVEWRPVTGALPPMSEQAWQAEFAKYKTIPQYQELNRGMSLDEFKAIYWWEWGAPAAGPLDRRGVPVAVPVVPLARLDRAWAAPRLWTIFGLGAVQGAVGWWMVASGLAERVSVSQYRLAFHLTLACVIFALLVWTAQRLDAACGAGIARAHPRVARCALLVLVLVQIYLGALVAGLRRRPDLQHLAADRRRAGAGRRPGCCSSSRWWRNFFENTLTVQFNHRMMAYAIVVVDDRCMSFDVGASNVSKAGAERRAGGGGDRDAASRTGRGDAPASGAADIGAGASGGGGSGVGSRGLACGACQSATLRSR